MKDKTVAWAVVVVPLVVVFVALLVATIWSFLDPA